MRANNRELFLGVMTSLLLAVSNLGCGAGQSSTPPQITVAVSPASGTVLASGTAQLVATVDHDPSNKGVTWTWSCPTGSCGSVSPTSTASGVATTYTAPAPPASDLHVTVNATSVADSRVLGWATVTVPAITVAGEPDSATVPGNTTAQFTATVGNDLSNKGVTWAVSCSRAPCGSVSPTSTASDVATTYTAPPQLPSDLTVKITATSVADSTKFYTCTATIPAISVSPISPNSALLPINTTQQFMATVDNDASNQGVSWSLTQNGTACSPVCGTISPATTASGAPTTYTPPSAVPANNSVTINATSVADTTKSANATITLTSGTVMLIPASLGFVCKLGLTCPPPAQTVALTNTGTAALTISSITITGSTTFTETNNCLPSVNGGSSCTITVKFNPTVKGTVNGDVSTSDSSVDSPQQVALSGTAKSIIQANHAQARSDLAATTYAAVPAPTGLNPVGTQVLYLTDPAREDPYLTNGTKRELAVRFWYPASANSVLDCKPADYASPAVWRYFAQLAGVLPFPVTTNSCWNAPIADGVHPVVLFTPGYTATATDYTFLLEDLASRGYVVASINHTYEATAAELADGLLARSVVGSHLGGPVLRKGWSMSSAVVVRLLDLKAVLNEIERLNARRDSPFAGKFDMAKIAVAGHSLGGLAAFLGGEFEPRLKAAVMLDGLVPDALGSASRKPVLILAAGRQRWDPGECRLWSNLQGPRLAVNLRGTEHVALSDWIWLTPNAVQVGPMGPERTMAAVRDYVAAFLDANLRDEPPAPLLTGGSVTYPDAQVTTQGQQLCLEP
jgi:dienelactone hydrolase